MPVKMNEDTGAALALLREGGYTCVLRKGERCYTSRERGVKPLMELIWSGLDLTGFSAADRVVGNGAAFLYAMLRVSEVYADVMSAPAAATLERYGIRSVCARSAAAIRNREGTGICPMEEAVQGAESPEEAYRRIREKLARMQRAKDGEKTVSGHSIK